jgi:GNAT superfamily N-acetyltransferase
MSGDVFFAAHVTVGGAIAGHDYRRRGLATRLLRRCLDDIAAAGLTAALDATAPGQTVYRALGFEDLWSFTRLVAHRRPRTAELPPLAGEITIRPIDDTAWPLICAADLRV